MAAILGRVIDSTAIQYKTGLQQTAEEVHDV
jgi:hypothetical protein